MIIRNIEQRIDMSSNFEQARQFFVQGLGHYQAGRFAGGRAGVRRFAGAGCRAGLRR